MGPRPHPSCACTTACLAPDILVSTGPRPHLWILIAKQRLLVQILYGSQTSFVVLSTHNSVLSTRISRPYGFQTSPVVLCMQNRDFNTRITSLYGSLTSPVVLCMENSVISTWISSLYWSLPPSVVFASKTATFGPELQVSMGNKPHQSFCVCKRGCIASELLVSMGPIHPLWFLDAKQRLLDQNNKSLWVPDITCSFVHAKQHKNY